MTELDKAIAMIEGLEKLESSMRERLLVVEQRIDGLEDVGSDIRSSLESLEKRISSIESGYVWQEPSSDP